QRKGIVHPDVDKSQYGQVPVFLFDEPYESESEHAKGKRLRARNAHAEEKRIRDSKQAQRPYPRVGNTLTVEKIPDGQKGKAGEKDGRPFCTDPEIAKRERDQRDVKEKV